MPSPEAKTTRSDDILASLPHRPPFRFITGDIELTSHESAQAVWRVNGDEAFFAGHFPGNPIVPGVLIGEALAQLSGLIAVDRQRRSESRPRAVANDQMPAWGKLAHVDLRFIDTVVPPAEIRLESKLERVFGKLWQFNTIARVGTARVARGTVTLAISDDGAPVRSDPA